MNNRSVTIYYSDGTEDKFTGESLRYVMNPDDAKGCVKVYQGAQTEIIPLAVVKRISCQF